MAQYNQVSYGSKDKNTVTELQKMLNQNGDYNLAEDGIFGSNTLDAVKKYQQANGLTVDGIVGQNTWAALTKNATGSSATEDTKTGFQYDPYQKSDAVTQAEALLQQHMAGKPGEYQSTWQEQLNDIIQQIQNREKFSYDLNGDALYQQYKDQYMQQGKMAMMDTMGQAQAMTGGYGNSYAQTAGQQAYQGQLQQLNDVIPELYQLALSQHKQEEQALYDQASLLAGMEEQDYGRYRDQVSDYNTELSRLTEDARYKAEQEYSKWADKLNLDYGMYRDTIADQQWQATFDEGVRQFEKQYALSAAKGSGGTGGANPTPYAMDVEEADKWSGRWSSIMNEDGTVSERDAKFMRDQMLAAGVSDDVAFTWYAYYMKEDDGDPDQTPTTVQPPTKGLKSTGSGGGKSGAGLVHVKN